MDQYTFAVNVGDAHTSIDVYERDDRGWLVRRWSDKRHYQATPAVVTQLVCGVLVALAGSGEWRSIQRDLCELTTDLW